MKINKLKSISISISISIAICLVAALWSEAQSTDRLEETAKILGRKNPSDFPPPPENTGQRRNSKEGSRLEEAAKILGRENPSDFPPPPESTGRRNSKDKK